MNSKETPIYQFSFTAEGPLSEFVFLELFDGDGKLVAGNYSNISEQLARGLYQLNIYSNEKLETETIRLDKDYSGNYTNQGSYSSISGYFLASSHEYYTETSKYWSDHFTSDEKKYEEGSSVFIFFRYPDRDIRDQQKNVADSMGWRFSILDKERNLLFRLNENNIKEDKDFGWLAFHAPLASGIYYLVYNGPMKREIPLYVFEDWQTQFFLTFKRTPIFPTARILFRKPNSAFGTFEKDNMEVDKLLRNMQNAIYHVPEQLLNRMASDDWQNPMLAIVVCYVYLMSSDVESNNSIKKVLENLKRRISNASDCPDIKAIELLAAVRFEKKIPEMILDEPCMLKVGFKTFLEQAARNPDKIQITELSEIITSLHGDMVWSSYKPVEKKKVQRAVGNEIGLEMSFTEPVEEPRDWLSQTMINQLSSENSGQNSVADLAIQFQVSPNMVKGCLQNLDSYLSNTGAGAFESFNADQAILKSNIQKLINTQ
ncbi:hypothetical protein [Chryseobacterium caseinilyticum]|uniref:TerB N-terminal domain-containing protein n=1 Tax=Chryseobacterium caseinilyticum TaxID=2771428 RepID=A0ABR8Z956_9FLAO|nr:hypothetical protein [Chryseobacterium caseinilyticum]MBD8081311.1 hypothetical protein [Chryseobacterium caseinilyticum]